MSRPNTRASSKPVNNEETGENIDVVCIASIMNEMKELRSSILDMKTVFDVVSKKLDEQNELISSLKKENSALISKISIIEANVSNHDMQISRETSQADLSTTTQQIMQSPSETIQPDLSITTQQIPREVFQPDPSTSTSSLGPSIFEPNSQSQHSWRERERRSRGSRSSNTRANSNISSNQGPATRTNNKILLIGDSIIKHIQPEKLSKNEVIKRPFPGKKIEDINVNNISDAITQSSKIIIHMGTNNIRDDTVDEIRDKYSTLICAIRLINPHGRIYLSSLTTRLDLSASDANADLNQVNDAIKALCKSAKCYFINNKNINESCLNNSKLHLNPKGTAYLATNFINAMRNIKDKKKDKKRNTNKSAIFQDAIHTIFQGLKELLLPHQ